MASWINTLKNYLPKMGIFKRSDKPEQPTASNPVSVDKSTQSSYTDVMQEIDSDTLYRPSQVAKKGWILNAVGKADYKYIIKLISGGKLSAVNISTGKNPHWRIKGSTIIAYRNSQPDVYSSPGVKFDQSQEKVLTQPA